MTDLPTRTAIFVNTRDALDRANSALSDARDWLKSDWASLGLELTPEAAAARTSILEAIAEAKRAHRRREGRRQRRDRLPAGAQRG